MQYFYLWTKWKELGGTACLLNHIRDKGLIFRSLKYVWVSGRNIQNFAYYLACFPVQHDYIITVKQSLGQSQCWGAHCINLLRVSGDWIKDTRIMEIRFSNYFHGQGCENHHSKACCGWQKRHFFFPFWIKNLIGTHSDFDILGTYLVYKRVGSSLEKDMRLLDTLGPILKYSEPNAMRFWNQWE